MVCHSNARVGALINYNLAKGEEIVGYFGYKDSQDTLMALGLITIESRVEEKEDV